MIKDNIKNSKNYYNLSERVKLGLEYLNNTDFSAIENGRYQILGNDVVAIVQDYLSKPLEEGQFEAHKNHIDIQYIIDGEEQIGVSNIENFSEDSDYNEINDIVFLKRKHNCKPEFLNLKRHEFVILNPDDAHMPSLSLEKPCHVKKAVIKISA